MNRRPLLILVSILMSPLSLIADPVWVEGETGSTTNLRTNSWYSSVREQDLSGEDWLASYGSKSPVTATFTIKLAKDGSYTLWVRANPIKATLHVAVGDSDDWLEVPISSDRHEVVNIATDGKPDLRFLAWSNVGPIALTEGCHQLRFRMSSRNGNHGAIDCFCLTTDSEWKPSGTLKPGESANWPAPKLTDSNLKQWGDFIRPSEKDLSWRGVRWHRHLDEAAAEASQLGRPVLLWAMNGHPCGET
jgi:hypothetical protein